MDGEHKRRFDVVLYLNGLPIALLELKRAGDAHADLSGAHAWRTPVASVTLRQRLLTHVFHRR